MSTSRTGPSRDGLLEVDIFEPDHGLDVEEGLFLERFVDPCL